jgi:hypothetical protein
MEDPSASFRNEFIELIVQKRSSLPLPIASRQVCLKESFRRLHDRNLHGTLPPSLPIQRPGVRARNNQGAKRPKTCRGVFFRLRYGFMAAVRGRPSGLPVALIAGFSPRARLSPKPVRRLVAAPQIKDVDHD